MQECRKVKRGLIVASFARACQAVLDRLLRRIPCCSSHGYSRMKGKPPGTKCGKYPAGGGPRWNGQNVDNDPGSRVYDPLLDTSLDLTRSRQAAVPIEFVGQHQRLVVNPLVAFLCGLSAALLIRHALHTRNVMLFCAGVGVLFLSFLLIQFHCRDCGSTGWYLHASRHACAAVVARWRQNMVPRVRFDRSQTTSYLVVHSRLRHSRLRSVPAFEDVSQAIAGAGPAEARSAHRPVSRRDVCCSIDQIILTVSSAACSDRPPHAGSSYGARCT